MQLEERDKRSQADSAEDASVPAAITDAGCERELNEDRYAVIESPSGLAWLVCDGMGGVTGGELAAQLALDAIRRDLENLPTRLPHDALKSAIFEANRIIVLRRQNPSFAHMGTTVVAALFAAPEVVIGNAGDSRAYLIHDGTIEQLTVDHTYVQELVEKGHIKQEDALSHPDAHILTRCIGAEPGLNLDLRRLWIWPQEPGESQDFLLLCTDGLYSQVQDDEMTAAVLEYGPQRACTVLVEKAKVRGGFDNITLAVIPLSGKLRNEPPLDYNEKAARRRVSARNEPPSAESQRNIVRDAVILGTLGLLAIMLTVIVFFVMLSAG